MYEGEPKREVDLTDPHLIVTLLSLAVSLPVFLYFLYQMVAHRNDWDLMFDDEGNQFSHSGEYSKRLERLKKKSRRESIDLLQGSSADAYAHLPKALQDAARKVQGKHRRSICDSENSSVQSRTPSHSPPVTPKQEELQLEPVVLRRRKVGATASEAKGGAAGSSTAAADASSLQTKPSSFAKGVSAKGVESKKDV